MKVPIAIWAQSIIILTMILSYQCRWEAHQDKKEWNRHEAKSSSSNKISKNSFNNSSKTFINSSKEILCLAIINKTLSFLVVIYRLLCIKRQNQMILWLSNSLQVLLTRIIYTCKVKCIISITIQQPYIIKVLRTFKMSIISNSSMTIKIIRGTLKSNTNSKWDKCNNNVEIFSINIISHKCQELVDRLFRTITPLNNFRLILGI